MPSELLTERDGAVLLLTISEPETRNTLSAQVLAAGIEALGVAEADPQVRAVILRGAGGHFCAGGNVRGLAERRAAGASAQRDMIEHLHHFVEALRVFPKPIVAAVEGAAAGAGFALALACDLIVAAENASFTMSYARLGLTPDAGSSWHLLQSLPRTLVQRMVWLAEPVSAAQLHASGIVGWVVADGQTSSEALRVASQLSTMAPNAVAGAKELVQLGSGRTLHEQLAAERDAFVANLFHENGNEGLQAFFEKRAPRFV